MWFIPIKHSYYIRTYTGIHTGISRLTYLCFGLKKSLYILSEQINYKYDTIQKYFARISAKYFCAPVVMKSETHFFYSISLNLIDNRYLR